MDRKLGWLPDLPDQRDYVYKVSRDPKVTITIPKRVNLSKYFPNIMDQGDIGSCVAQATIASLEYLEKRERGEAIRLSPMMAYYSARAVRGWEVLWYSSTSDLVKENLMS